MSRIYDALKKLEEERGRKTTGARERPTDVLATRIVAKVSVPSPRPVQPSVPTQHRRPMSGRTATALGLVALAAAWTGWRSSGARYPIHTSGAPVTKTLVAEGTAPVPPSGSAETAAPREEERRDAIPTPKLPEETTSNGPPTAPSPSTASRGLVRQVGAFLSADNAEALRRRLAERYRDVYVSVVQRSGRSYYRVRIGGLASEGERRAVATSLRNAGYASTPVHDVGRGGEE